MADRGEIDIADQRSAEVHKCRTEIHPAPRPRHPVGQHRAHPGEKVTDPDVADVNEPFGCEVVIDRQIQQTLADVGGQHVGD